MSDLARELDYDWRTINDTVIAYGEASVDDPARIGDVDALGLDALGLDETLFARVGRWRTQAWSTSIVDVEAGQLLDVVPGRSAAGACEWLAARDQPWLDAIYRFPVILGRKPLPHRRATRRRRHLRRREKLLP